MSVNEDNSLINYRNNNKFTEKNNGGGGIKKNDLVENPCLLKDIRRILIKKMRRNPDSGK